MCSYATDRCDFPDRRSRPPWLISSFCCPSILGLLAPVDLELPRHRGRSSSIYVRVTHTALALEQVGGTRLQTSWKKAGYSSPRQHRSSSRVLDLVGIARLLLHDLATVRVLASQRTDWRCLCGRDRRVSYYRRDGQGRSLLLKLVGRELALWYSCRDAHWGCLNNSGARWGRSTFKTGTPPNQVMNRRPRAGPGTVPIGGD